jgi:hypothetical protein
VATAGSLSVLAIYLLGYLLYSYREGLVAAGLLAVSWGPIYYSQQARTYSFLILAAIITIILGLAALGEERARRRWFLAAVYVIAASYMSYLHYFGALMAGLQLLAAFVLCYGHKVRRKIIMGAGAAVAVLYLPWLPAILESLRFEAYWISEPESGPFELFWSWIMWSMGGKAPVRSTLYPAGIISLSVIVMALKSMRTKAGEGGAGEVIKLWRSAGFLLFLWLVLPFLAAYLKSVVSIPVYKHRYILVSYPALALLGGRGIVSVFRKKYLWPAVTVLVMLMMGYALIVDDGYYSRKHKTQYREATGQLAAELADARNPLVCVTGRWSYFLKHYLDGTGVYRFVPEESCLLPGIEDVDKMTRRFRQGKHDELYLFVHRNRSDQEIMVRVSAQYEELSAWDYFGVRLLKLVPGE